VAVLDYSSLYPSVMIQHNICYSTLVLDDAELGEGVETFETPIGARFVASSSRRGEVPAMLDDLLTARRHAIAEAAKAGPGSAIKVVLDARNKALKVRSRVGWAGVDGT
jgi:DNA polymerase delta subunit 1